MRERVDRTLEHHREAILRERSRYLDRGRGANYPPLLHVRNLPRLGFRVYGLPLAKAVVESWIPASRPKLRHELLRRRPGFDAVYIDVEYGGGVRWVARGGVDSQVPAGIEEREAGE